MHGTPFFTSARRAFGLIFRNLARVAVVTVISDFVIFIGKVAVMLTCCGIAYYYMVNYMKVSEAAGIFGDNYPTGGFDGVLFTSSVYCFCLV